MSWPYSITTRATGTTLTAAIYNADHQNHSDNNIPTSIDDYSTNATQMRATTDPGESGTESLATSLDGELERIRFAIKELKDVVHGSSMAQWYSTTANTTASPRFAGLKVGTAAEIGNAANAGVVSLYDSTGGTSYQTLEIASNRADSNGGTYGMLEFSANSQSAGHKAMATIVLASQGDTANQRGGQLQFYTKANGATALSHRGSIDQDGTFTWLGNITSTGLTVTVDNNARATVASTGTNGTYDRWTNAADSLRIGMDSNAGGAIIGTGGGNCGIIGTTGPYQLLFGTNNIIYMALGAGLQMGVPTGGDKGSGTINVATDIYKNGTAYTNPHGGFEYAYTGKVERFADRMAEMKLPNYKPLSLDDLETFTREHFHFPYFGDDQELGGFSGGERLLLITEELAVHLFRLHHRVRCLENNAKIIQ